MLLESGEDVDQRDQVLVFSSSFNSSVKLIFFSHTVCASSMAYKQAIVLVFAVVLGGVSSQRENRPFAGGQSRVKKPCQDTRDPLGRVKQTTHAIIRLNLIVLVKLSTARTRTLMMTSV